MKIGIIGVGRLGLSVAVTLRNAGHEVFGYDINVGLIEALQNGMHKTAEPGVQSELGNTEKLHFTNDLSMVLSENIDILLTYVPTPSNNDGSFNHDSIDVIIENLEKNGKRKNSIPFVIGSTVIPGYSNSILNKLTNLNYSLIYNPEFIAQGSILNDLKNPDQVLIGETDKKSGDIIEQLYRSFINNQPTFCRMSLVSAEITKLATNCFLTTKISFANAIGDLTKELGGNPDDVLNAIGSDSRIGNKYLHYGFGFGGPCFPRDNQALISTASQVQMPLHIAEATILVNKEHLNYQINEYLKQEKDVYHIDYVSYKPGTDIIEESQQLQLALELVRNGKKVVILNHSNIKEQLEQMFPGYFSFQ